MWKLPSIPTTTSPEYRRYFSSGVSVVYAEHVPSFISLILTIGNGVLSVVKYSVEKLLEIRYIVSYKMTTGNNHSIVTCPISDITYEGHQFLNTIRPDTVWQATKKGASKLGIMSMHALSSIAMKVAEVIISDPTVIAKIVSML